MTAMQQVLTEIENVRRAELVADTRSALAVGVSLDEYLLLREKSVSDWCQWLHGEMDRTRAADPTEILPQICARLEQRCAAAARAAAKAAAQEQVKLMLGRAIR
jgi:hypothetical protein